MNENIEKTKIRNTVEREEFNLLLSTSGILILKSFRDVRKGTHLISPYINNELPVKMHQLAVNDRIGLVDYNW